MKKLATLGITCAVAVLSAHAPAAANADAFDQPAPAEGELASFEGDTLDLRISWGNARACATDGLTTTCFRSEKEMDKFIARSVMATEVGMTTETAAASTWSSCSSSVRLYSGPSYTGTVLGFTTRFVFINLSAYGFSNVTSSYKTGACPAIFYDGAYGAGPVYPGNTNAWVWSSSMVAGWDNRLSSIIIG